MSTCNNWYFPALRGGERSGSTVGDKEIFKKDPYVSLARETLQNSIDVREHDDEPARVEFKTFRIKTNKIPNIEELKAQLQRCVSFWTAQEEIVKKYKEMIDFLNEDELECMRISDFNTSGLTGIYSSKEKDNKFKALVKSTGVSVKTSSNAGGSKGVGKNAAIILSKNLFVWYTTMTTEKEVGSIGIVDIVSGFPKDNTTDRDYFTQGKGYYASDENTNAINEIINLDENFNRDEPGTDVYIINFRNIDNWKNEIISSVINSFSVAILKDQLNVEIDDVVINKETIYDLICDKTIMKNKKFYCSAMSNYRILQSDCANVKRYDIETKLGNASLYILPLNKNIDDCITHECEMVRYPYLKITSFCRSSYLDFSALCVIDDNDLGIFLRSIENPEHTKWSPNSLEDKVKISFAKSLLDDIEQQIEKYIEDALNVNNESEIDPSRAGEFLRSVDGGDGYSGVGEEEVPGDKKHKSSVGTLVRIKPVSPNANVNTNSDDGDGLTPVIGDIDPEPGDVVHPDGNNGGNGGQPRPGEKEGTLTDGDLITLERNDKTQVKYNFITLDKNNGKYKIVFISPATKDECYIQLNLLGDSPNQKKYIKLDSMKVNGLNIDLKDDDKYGPFKVSEGNKCIIEIKTSTIKGNFGSEVKILCK